MAILIGIMQIFIITFAILGDIYATIYPTPNPSNTELVFPEPFPYFVGINPDDFTDFWPITL